MQKYIIFRKKLFLNLLYFIPCLVFNSGCDLSNGTNFSKISTGYKKIIFSEVKVPSNDAEKRRINSVRSLIVGGKNIEIEEYQVLMRVGDDFKGTYQFGELVNREMESLIEKSPNNSLRKRISNAPDFSSILVGIKDQELYMVTHFEDVPAGMYLTELNQNKDGKLSAQRTRPIDFSSVNGGWIHCAGSVTPWGSHLGSEEYEPNAAKAKLESSRKFSAMQAYFQGSKLEIMKPNPYDYGFVVEVKVNNYREVNVSKKLAIGRFSVELAYVMPDQRTVYISDDGTDVGFYRFVADQPKDLSSGQLYAAKWIQENVEGKKAKAMLAWKSLGHAKTGDIQPFLDAKNDFKDIFTRDAPGCKQINTLTGKECLLVKSGMEKIASRLETRRYAALMGATTEWRKTEGITFNPIKNTLYLSASAVNKGMEKNKNILLDHIQLEKNDCGAVYELTLDESYVAVSIRELLSGVSIENDSNNKCALDHIANPDNLTFIPQAQQLIIAEDSRSGHQNDMLWSYDINTQKLNRILTAPYGAEITSVYYYPNINNYGYLMTVLQHPFGETDQEKLKEAGEARSYVGYLGPFPLLQ